MKIRKIISLVLLARLAQRLLSGRRPKPAAPPNAGQDQAGRPQTRRQRRS